MGDDNRAARNLMTDQAEPPAAAFDANELARPTLPPLRIHHIMLWTVVTAATLSAIRVYFSANTDGQPFAEEPFGALLIVFFSTLASGAMVVSGLGIYWRKHGYAFNEPGQRLAIDIAVRSLLVALFYSIGLLIERSSSPPSGQVFFVFTSLGFLAVAIFQIFLARPLSQLWKVLFWCKAGFLVSACVLLWVMDQVIRSRVFLDVAPFMILGGYCVLILLQLFGIRQDRKHQRRRHWTHWYGLLAHLAINSAIAIGTALALIAFIASRW